MAAKEAATLSSLMDGLQVRTPYLDTDSLISNACDKVIEDEGKSVLAKEEAKLEQKIIRTILSSKSDSLKPNSGQAVTIGDHQICVGCQENAESGYRVWEWHGHIMIYSDDKGYVPEYIYGNYFQRVAGQQGHDDDDEDDEDFERESAVSRIAGLRDIMANVDDVNARILCRNINLASKR